jgi:MFS family permease
MTSSGTTDASPRVHALSRSDYKRVLGSSMIGSVIEYYDFILYANAAALIFDKVFFANLTGPMALIASFATLAVGYFARPIGGIIFGHFGDRVSRKKMLVISMMMMGCATVAIGLVPTPAVIGVWAPLLLILLRVVQGISVGGEWGGATLMALEHAPENRRGFAAAFANAGGPMGGLLATFVLSGVSAATGEQFLVWGWRIPFLLSAVLIVVGLVIRLKVSESPAIAQIEEAASQEERKRKMPIVEVLTQHWRTVVITLVASLGFYSFQGILTSWGTKAAVTSGVPRELVLNLNGLGAVVTIVVCFTSARLSDKVGRAKMLIIASIAGMIWVIPALTLLTSGSGWGYLLAIVVGSGLIQGTFAGSIGAFISERFPARVRYTGASLSYQGASTLGGGLTPIFAVAAMAAGGIGAVGAVWVGILALGLVALVVAARTGGDNTPSGTPKGAQEVPNGEAEAASASAA